MSNSRVGSCANMSFAVTRLFGVTRKPGVCSWVSRPMWCEYRIVNIESAAFSCCVCPISIPRRGKSRLLPKVSCEVSILERRCKDRFDAVEGVHGFGFKNKARGSSKMKPICSWSAVTVVFLHSNMMFGVGIDGYYIRYIGVTRQSNRRECVSNGCSVLG